MTGKSFSRLFVFLLLLCAVSLGQVKLTVTPTSATLHIGNEQQFSASVTGATTNTVTWAINGVVGGNSTLGTVSNGRYSPPAVVPTPNTVTLTVTHNDSGTVVSVPVTVLNPYPMLASTVPGSLSPGLFGMTINGSGFANGAKVYLAGEPLATTFVNSTRLIAMGTISAKNYVRLPLTVMNPDPGGLSSASVDIEVNHPKNFSPKVTEIAAARFLEQASFGPDRASIEDVQRIGFEAWIEDQFSAPVSQYQEPSMLSTSLGPLQSRFFTNAVHGRDQLRQRMVFALGQIWVVSGAVATTPERLVPYLRVLQRNAFDNFRNLMYEMTLSPTMGDYLNMVNNVKANTATGTRANENYAREIMQLFTIGMVVLNPDGTPKRDANGDPLVTYTQKDIQELSRVFTGWTYPTMPGAKPAARNAAYYNGLMEPWESNHDTGSKTIVGGAVLPAGLNATDDLNMALDVLFNHPSTAPFICKNLIQHFVKSNPSPEYVARVVAAFNGNGSSTRGDLKNVIKAILLDPEARAGDDGSTPVATEGHLREPVLWITSILRALGALVNDTNSLASRGAAMGQNVLLSPTVFNYFMPGNTLAGSPLLAPEFQLLTPATALERANQVNTLIYSSLGAGTVIITDEYTFLALSPTDLVNAVDADLFQGRMPLDMKRIIMQAVIDTPGERAKAQAALYLALSSGYWAVQH